MKSRYDYKSIITLCSVYEIISFLVLFTHDTCDLWLYPCGLQYILLCLILPILVVLLWCWRKEVFKWSKTAQKHTIYIAAFVMVVFLGGYLLARPTIFDFTDRDLLESLRENVENECLKENSNSKLPKVDITKKCSGLSMLMEASFMNKIVTKQQVEQKLHQVKENYKNYPNYAIKTCEEIAKEERHSCHLEKNNYNYCNCYGDMVAFQIKKDYNLKSFDAGINSNLEILRKTAMEYCVQEYKSNKLEYWPWEAKVFCDRNNI